MVNNERQINLSWCWLAILVTNLLVITSCSTPSQVKLEPLPKLDSRVATKLAWVRVDVTEAKRHSVRQPLYLGDRQFYWTDREGDVHAYQVNTGKPVWRFKSESPVSSGLGGNDNTVFAGTRDARFLAIDKEKGQLRWKVQVSSVILAPPQVHGDMVIVHTVDGNIMGLDTTDGHELWRYKSKVPLLTLRGASTPQIIDGSVIVGLANGKLVSINHSDGKPIWLAVIAAPRGRTELERMVDIDATPRIDDGMVYTVAYQGRIAAVSLSTGRIKWARDLSSSLGMDLDSTYLYVTTNEGEVWAFAQSDGSVFWKQDELVNRGITAPAILGGYLVVGDVEGYLHWIELDTGYIVHRSRLDDTPIDMGPQVHDNVLYVASRGGIFNAITLPDKSKK